MTFDETSILDVVLDVSEVTPSIGQAAAEELKALLMSAQSGDTGFFWMGSQPWLKVNADGKRFFNESGT